jgi:hypothetical protein
MPERKPGFFADISPASMATKIWPSDAVAFNVAVHYHIDLLICFNLKITLYVLYRAAAQKIHRCTGAR